MNEALDNSLDFLVRRRMGLRKGHAHNVALQLHIACADWVLLKMFPGVTAWMAELAYNQASMLLAGLSKFLERFKALSGKRAPRWNDCIAGGFQLVRLEHDVPYTTHCQRCLQGYQYDVQALPVKIMPNPPSPHRL
jgi:hypothetical protein